MGKESQTQAKVQCIRGTDNVCQNVCPLIVYKLEARHLRDVYTESYVIDNAEIVVC